MKYPKTTKKNIVKPMILDMHNDKLEIIKGWVAHILDAQKTF